MSELARIHHYVLEDGRSRGECRPMIVVAEWTPGMVNGLVFLDGTNDGLSFDNDHVDPSGTGTFGLSWKTSRKRSSAGEPTTWHPWQECPKAARIGGMKRTPTAFLASDRDVVKANPDLAYVIDVPGLRIPWPDGVTLAGALREWRSEATTPATVRETTRPTGEIVPPAAANPYTA